MKNFLITLIVLTLVFGVSITNGFAAAGDPVLEPILITQMESTDLSGSDDTFITGTAGTDTYGAVWNSDGDLVNGAGVPAITDLSNIAATAIPVSLISDTAATDDLGTEAIYWLKAYLGTGISFEGATDDEHQTSIVITDPTADRSITFPNTDQTVGVATSAAADAIDAITEIASALKTGSDVKLVTGTAGASGNIAAWNADGDIVDGGSTSPGSLGAFTAIEAAGGIATIGAANFIDIDGEGSAADDITELAGSAIGDLVVLQNSAAGSYTITMKDGTYLLLQGDFLLDDIGDSITLICTIAGVNETYAELMRASNG